MTPAIFEVINAGHSPIRILSIGNTCGCAKPKVEPNLVTPGGLAIVSVEVTPLVVGERRVSITLNTDSSATPEVPLELLVRGSRRAPFLFNAGGDLSFCGDEEWSEIVREVMAETIEPLARSATPTARVDLPFLRLDPPRVEERPHASDPTLVGRRYFFPIRFATEPPAGAFAGEVVVNDPWEPGRAIPIRVQGQTSPPVRTIPARLVLNTGNPPIKARLMVRTRHPESDIRIEAEGGEDTPLTIAPVGPPEAGRAPTFEIGLKPERPVVGGVHNLVVHAGSSRVVVPVMVKAKEVAR